MRYPGIVPVPGSGEGLPPGVLVPPPALRAPPFRMPLRPPLPPAFPSPPPDNAPAGPARAGAPDRGGLAPSSSTQRTPFLDFSGAGGARGAAAPPSLGRREGWGSGAEPTAVPDAATRGAAAACSTAAAAEEGGDPPGPPPGSWPPPPAPPSPSPPLGRELLTFSIVEAPFSGEVLVEAGLLRVGPVAAVTGAPDDSPAGGAFAPSGDGKLPKNSCLSL